MRSLLALIIATGGLHGLAAAMEPVNMESLYGAPKGQAEGLRLMHPDADTLRAWDQRRFRGQQVPPAPPAKALPEAVDLLPYFEYVPEEHDQGDCGNCWAWAATGCIQMRLSTQYGVRDRLSTQLITSCFLDHFACMGGLDIDGASFYNRTGYCIPWSNPNAAYAQYDTDYETMTPATLCEDIGTAPRYLLHNVAPRIVPTWAMTREEAIDTLKYELSQGNALFFAFYLPEAADGDAFRTYWLEHGEDEYIDLSAWDGHTWDEDAGGGHAVLCVGYRDNAWLLLNSWGTVEGLRPNGLFAVGPMDSMDYAAAYVHEEAKSSHALFFWSVLDTSYAGYDGDGDGVSDAVEAEFGTDPMDRTDAPALPLPWPLVGLTLAVAGGAVLVRRRL